MLELITTTALDEDRTTPLGETRGDRLQRRNDADLALEIVLLQHTRTDLLGLGPNDEQPVTFAQRQRTAEVAVVGLAPSGGRLPEGMRADVRAALQAGLSLASGLHGRLVDDPEFASIPLRPGQWIWDLRQEPAGLEVATARAAALPCRRVLAVGSDMAVGKMSACLELQAEARRRGCDARFVGTGQAGILIAGTGVALDAVRVDYAAGAVEAAVMAAAEGAGIRLGCWWRGRDPSAIPAPPPPSTMTLLGT